MLRLTRPTRNALRLMCFGLALSAHLACGGGGGGSTTPPPPTSLTYSANPATFTKGTAITADSPSHGGGAPTFYSVTPALPAGLSLNMSTGVISGTPTALAATATHTVTAGNSGGSTTASLSITVNDIPPTALTYTATSAMYYSGVAITPNTPSNGGGAAVSYAISPALPAGLALNTSTGVINGTPTTPSATTTYTVTATNSGGSTTATLTLTIASAPSNLAYITNPATYTVGSSIPANTSSYTGGAPTAYAVSPALPAGLTLDTSTGVITGTPISVAATATYTVTASNGSGSSSVGLSITINPAAPSSLVYSTNPAAYPTGIAIAPNTPSRTGGAPTAYAVSPALPAGLALNASTGALTGTPTTPTPAATYTITGSNISGGASVDLILTISNTAPNNLTYSTNPATYTMTLAIPPNTPSYGGGAPTSYSVSPALPPGLAMDVSSGVITGTPTAAVAQAIYTVTATNASGATSVGLNITVLSHTLPPPPNIFVQPADATVHMGSDASFSCGANGATPFSRQWQKNDVDISGASAAAYTFPAAALTDTGTTFRCVVTDPYGQKAYSREALLTVYRGLFTATGSMVGSTGRYLHTATLLPDGNVLLAGGSDGSGALGTADLYDTTSGTFTFMALGPTRMYHTATLLSNGKVLITGGYNGTSPLSSAILYDPPTKTYASTGDLGSARCDHTATLLPSGKVLIAGGHGAAGAPLQSAELYDPVAGTFSSTGDMATARGNHTATLLSSGKVLIAGGRTFSGTVMAGCELYDPSLGTFAPTGSLTVARYSHTATLLANGMVVMIGGPTTTTVELYDPGPGMFSLVSGLSLNRQGHTATLLLSGEVLVAGGSALQQNLRWDPTSGIHNPTGNMTHNRDGHTATLLTNGKVLVAGGEGSVGSLTSADLFDPE